MKKHKFYLAPLRGITDYIFRSVYEKHFGRFDYMLAPFVPTVRGNRVRDYHISDLLNENDPTRLIPQIIGNDSNGFLLLCNRFADMGFTSVNWNLGCPAPLVMKKKRGAGLLPYGDIIERFLGEVMPKLPIPLSIKARLGLDKNDELYNLISAFNDCQLKELIIHPRTGSQAYGGTVDLDKFEGCLYKSTNTVVYNGDICSVDDFQRLSKRFPGVNKWMLGRGIIKNPCLLSELRNAAGDTVDNSESAVILEKNQAVRDFLGGLLDENLNRLNPTKVLGKMKELWQYLGQNEELVIANNMLVMTNKMLAATNKPSEKIMRCETIGEYGEIF